MNKNYLHASIIDLTPQSLYYWDTKNPNHQTKEQEERRNKLLEIHQQNPCYGVVRLTQAMQNSGYMYCIHTIRSDMHFLGIKATSRPLKKKVYSSYDKDKSREQNLLLNSTGRNFKANAPRTIVTTDVTEFALNNLSQKIYLATFIDSFDKTVLAFSISTSPTIRFTNAAFSKTIEQIPAINNCIIHSDRGVHYQHASFKELAQSNNMRQSLSRKGNCLDNSPSESFHSIIKRESNYESCKTIEELAICIMKFMEYYNYERVHSTLGVPPATYYVMHKKGMLV